MQNFYNSINSSYQLRTGGSEHLYCARTGDILSSPASAGTNMYLAVSIQTHAMCAVKRPSERNQDCLGSRDYGLATRHA